LLTELFPLGERAGKGGAVRVVGSLREAFDEGGHLLIVGCGPRHTQGRSVQQIGSKVSADITQGELHFRGRGETVTTGRGARLDEEFRELRPEV
jgi:hypothetical protein